MSDEQTPAPKCIVCDNDAATRGVCTGCYGTFQGLVKKGETTWEALETAGLVLPSKRKNTGPSAALAAFKSMGSPGRVPAGPTA